MRKLNRFIRFKTFLLLLTVSVFTYNRQRRSRQFSDDASILDDQLDVSDSNLESSSHPFQFQSTCRFHADERGPHQNVISFSIYGNLTNENNFVRYVVPLKSTVERVASVYPGWTVRIYHNFKDEPDYQKLCQTFDAYRHVDLWNATRVLDERNLTVETFPMNWRFLPLIDENVDQFMSRDSDSLILQREVEAVGQWIQGPSTFHIIRDHPSTPILGGLWGVKLQAKRRQISQAVTQLFKKRTKNLKGIDQFLLRRYIWPIAKNDVIAHDSYCCTTFPNTRHFPVRRDGNQFVGMVALDANTQVEPVTCPRQCRPASHPDWLYC